MQALHGLGRNVWADEAVIKATEFTPSMSGDDMSTIPGSPLNAALLEALLVGVRPHLVLEVGVFHGHTSIQAAKLLDYSCRTLCVLYAQRAERAGQM